MYLNHIVHSEIHFHNTNELTFNRNGVSLNKNNNKDGDKWSDDVT